MEQQQMALNPNEVSIEVDGRQPALVPDAEVRSLQELELVLVSGGSDGAVIWP